MLSSLSLMAPGLIALALQAAPGESEHAEHFMKCATVCAGCQLQCDSCFKHCLTMLEEGKKEHAKAAQLCADCAECCKLAATLSARQSPLAGPACVCCAECCDMCAEECEKHPDDAKMAACAKSCRECAKSCREMAKMMGAGA